MRPIPESARKADWPRRVSQIVNELVRLYNAGELGGGGSANFGPADLWAHDETYLYFGFEDGWRIRRVLRADGTSGEAGSAGYADLAAAWPNRVGLTYA